MSRVDAYRPGDVVLFSRKGRLFVHRVVELSGGAVVTRGDSMLDADPPVAVSDVLGRVEAIERGGSRVAVARRVVSILEWHDADWHVRRDDRVFGSGADRRASTRCQRSICISDGGLRMAVRSAPL